MSKPTEDMLNQLYDALLSLKTRDEMRCFLDDLCTYKEIEAMASRLCAAKLLKEGITYAQTVEETGLSSATISRVSRCLQFGTGYNQILSNIKNQK